MTPRKADRNEEIARRHAAGERTSDLAASFDLHITRVSQILRQEKARASAPAKPVPTEGLTGALDREIAMQQKVRPRIRKAVSGLWECSDGLVSRAAHTPQGAYQRWLTAALIEEERRLAPTEWPNPAEVAPAPKRPATVKGKTTTGVVVPSCRKMPAAKPEAYVGPVTVVPGTREFKPLTLSTALRMNGARAREVQPPMMTVAGADRDAA